MLEIQKYIANHSNWYNLLQEEPYNLKIRNKDNLYKFDYTIDSKPPHARNFNRVRLHK